MAFLTFKVINRIVNVSCYSWDIRITPGNHIWLIPRSHVMAGHTALTGMRNIHLGLGEHLTGGKQKK